MSGSSGNLISKTGLIASPRKQIKRINKISKSDSIAASLLKCTVTKPVQFSLRPFGGLFNPYSKGCSILCNHPGPNDIKTVVKNAKEMWLHEGGQKTTMQYGGRTNNCIMMPSSAAAAAAAAPSSSSYDGIQQNGYHRYHRNHVELTTMDNDMIPEHIPEEFFRRYTGSDSRPLTPTPTVVSGRTRTSTGSHLNNRRCFTPEPTNSSCAKERKQLILDLRRSHSQETLFWNASSDLSPGTAVQQQAGSIATAHHQRVNSTVGKQSTRNQRLCEQESQRKSAEKKAQQQKLAAENEGKSTVQSTTICINERDMDEDEDGPRRRGKRKKKTTTKMQTQTSTTFHLNNNQEPETQIATLGPDSLNASARPSLIPNGSNIPRLSLVMTDNLYGGGGGYSAANPLIGGANNLAAGGIGSRFQSSFINEDTLKILRRGLNIDIVESTFERCMNRALTEALRTIPTEKINYESEALKQFKESLTITHVDNEKWLNMPRKYTRNSARFTLPINTNDLTKMTPLEYVSKHIWISDYRKQLYKYVFQKYLPDLQSTNSPQIRTPSMMANVHHHNNNHHHRNTTLIVVNNKADDDDDDDSSDDDYSGQQSIKQKKKSQQNHHHHQQQSIEERKISYSDLFVALQNVLGYHGTIEKIEMLKMLLKLTDVEMKFPFRTWCGIVAFAERYLNELPHDQDPCDEVEIADFESLERKYSYISVSDDLKQILNFIKKTY